MNALNESEYNQIQINASKRKYTKVNPIKYEWLCVNASTNSCKWVSVETNASKYNWILMQMNGNVQKCEWKHVNADEYKWMQVNTIKYEWIQVIASGTLQAPSIITVKF